MSHLEKSILAMFPLGRKRQEAVISRTRLVINATDVEAFAASEEGYENVSGFVRHDSGGDFGPLPLTVTGGVLELDTVFARFCERPAETEATRAVAASTVETAFILIAFER
jgi:hypothetical protein